MAAKHSSNSIRVRLYFDYPPPAVCDCRMCWLLVDLNKCRVVADLESVIRDQFDFSRKSVLNLFVDDCYLPHTESICVVRDNDGISVKVDRLVPANGHRSSLAAPVEERPSGKKRRRFSGEDAAAVSSVGDCLSSKWKKKKRKKRSEESPGRDGEQTKSDGGQQGSRKKSTRKKTTQKEVGAAAKPSAPAAENTAERVEDTRKAPGPKPVHVNGKARAQDSSSLDSSDGSSEEEKAPKRLLGQKNITKMPPVVAPPSKAKSASEKPQPPPRPSPSSSETDTSSDEAPAKKNTSLAENPNSAASKSRTGVGITPHSGAWPASSGTTQPAGAVDSDSSSSEEEITLVIKRPLQGPDLGAGASGPPCQGRGGGRGNPIHGGGGRGGIGGRGAAGQSGQFHYKYDEGRQRELPSYRSDSLTNHSAFLQNQIATTPKRDYGAMPLLAAPPGVGQKIAFKLLELTENYTPEVSEYKEGKIIGFDPATKQIELELLNATRAPTEPGKFDLVYQNSDGTERVEYAVPRESRVTEWWDSLLEPRLVIENEATQ